MCHEINYFCQKAEIFIQYLNAPDEDFFSDPVFHCFSGLLQ